MPAKGQPSRRVQTEPKNERWNAFMNGELTVHDMDEEELARGTFRAKDGTFRGRPPKTIPRDFATQLSRELLTRADSALKKRIMEAIDVLYEEMKDGEKSADRIRAANIFLERVLGKVPERVVVSPGRPEWEGAVDEFVAGLEDEKIKRARVVLGREET
jgi:hypothetical protein